MPQSLDWQVLAGQWNIQGDRLTHTPTSAKGERIDVARGRLQCILPERGADRVDFSLRVSSPKPQGIAVSLDDATLNFAARWRTPLVPPPPFPRREEPMRNEELNRESFLQVGYRNQIVEYDLSCAAVPGKGHTIRAEGTPARVVFSVDGREIFTWTREQRRPFRSVYLEVWCEAEMEVLDMTLDGPHRAPSVKPSKRLVLSTSFDGVDIRNGCQWTPKMLRQTFRILKEMSFDRVYFIDYGSPVPEFWSDPDMIRCHREMYGHLPHYEKVMRDEREWLGVAAELAHEAGLQFYTKLKVLDLHLWSERREENFLDRQMVQYEHREKKLRRRPLPPRYASPDAPVGTIRFVRDDAERSPVDPNELRIWVSDDNRRYRPYEGPRTARESVERRGFHRWWEETDEPPRDVRVVSLEGLNVTAPYFAVTVPPDRRDELFRNRLHRLVEMESVDGKPFPFSYAIVPDCDPDPNAGPDDFPWHGKPRWKGGLRIGLYWGGVPSGAIQGCDPMERYWALDNRARVVGFARGVVEYGTSVFCPAYDEVHEFWLSRIRTAYDAGADGVDLRLRNHNKSVEWSRLGWNDPVVDEYRRRYGVDIRTQAVDQEKFQRLLGEHYTGFLRKARALSNEKGKSLQHHVSASLDGSPDRLCLCHIHWDWRTWVREGLVDEVTLKEVFPGTPFFDEVMDVLRGTDIRAHFCPFMNSVLSRDPNYADVIAGHVANARKAGLDGFWLHEAFCLFEKDIPNETVKLVRPGVADAVRGEQD